MKYTHLYIKGSSVYLSVWMSPMGLRHYKCAGGVRVYKNTSHYNTAYISHLVNGWCNNDTHKFLTPLNLFGGQTFFWGKTNFLGQRKVFGI